MIENSLTLNYLKFSMQLIVEANKLRVVKN